MKSYEKTVSHGHFASLIAMFSKQKTAPTTALAPLPRSCGGLMQAARRQPGGA